MHLDETILQSRTTLQLIDFIKEIWPLVEPNTEHDAISLLNKYEYIVNSARKAEKKRSFD